MRNIVTVVTPATNRNLTTLERVKDEFGIFDEASDGYLTNKIDDVSSIIARHLGYTLARETLSEVIGADRRGCTEELVLSRTPVALITSVTLDGCLIASPGYGWDRETGILNRIGDDGYPSMWRFARTGVVVYEAGYIMPGDPGADLDPSLEAAAITLLRGFWFSRGRDPMLKAEEIPGVMRQEFWVGSTNASGLPPEVAEILAPFRRVFVA